MDDDAVVWTLGGVLLLIGIGLLVIAGIFVAGWAIRCPMGKTACDCEGDYPRQCNYQCYPAEKCTCSDLDDMKTSRDNLNKFVGKKEAGGSSGSGSGDGGGQRDWLEGGKIAGLTDEGEIWIDKSVMDNHCKDVVDSIYEHELVHKGDDKCQNPLNYFSWTIRQMMESNAAQTLHDKSEFSAYNTQTTFLDMKIAFMEPTCSAGYKCGYSGEMFDTATDCIDNCGCSLAHPCAPTKPHCIEVNTKTGEPTGRRF